MTSRDIVDLMTIAILMTVGSHSSEDSLTARDT